MHKNDWFVTVGLWSVLCVICFFFFTLFIVVLSFIYGLLSEI